MVIVAFREKYHSPNRGIDLWLSTYFFTSFWYDNGIDRCLFSNVSSVSEK